MEEDTSISTHYCVHRLEGKARYIAFLSTIKRNNIVKNILDMSNLPFRVIIYAFEYYRGSRNTGSAICVYISEDAYLGH